jgi:hypothetical protein
MKKLFFILLIILSKTSFSQNTEFTLGLILPEPNQKLNEVQISKLESKLSNLINKSEIATYGYNNDFVIYPIVNIDDIGIVQGGLENITVATIDLTLNIKQISSNKSLENGLSKYSKYLTVINNKINIDTINILL